MGAKEDLEKMLGAFSELDDVDKIEEINQKIKRITALLNGFNDDKELIVASKNEDDLTEIYNLLCCLEEELGKYLSKKEQ